MIWSCKPQQSGNADGEKIDPEKVYYLRLNPQPGSAYHYEIINETDTEAEVDDKKVNNENITETGVTYSITKDSADNFLFSSVYDKVKISNDNNGTKTEMDAENASFSPDPVEKMLGLLKGAAISVSINSTGEVVDMKGYKELGEQLIEKFSKADELGRKAAREQWEKYIGKGMIRNNFDQLFKFFPDSAVHLGDTWKLTSRQEGDLNYNITGEYKLKAINPEIAIIESEGVISTSVTNTQSLDVEDPNADLSGEQTAEFEIETKTGMVLSCKVKSEIKGTVMAYGREVPVQATISVKVKGKRVK